MYASFNMRIYINKSYAATPNSFKIKLKKYLFSISYMNKKKMKSSKKLDKYLIKFFKYN